MTKEEKREARIRIIGHSLDWWVTRGVKCPDCEEAVVLAITEQVKDISERVSSTMQDETFTAFFTCRCGCEFAADFIEYNVRPKKEAWSRGDLWG